LRMATTAHGGAGQPPLRSRATPAYHTLEQWVKLAASHAPKTTALMSDASVATPDKPAKNVFENVERKALKDNLAVEKETPLNAKEAFAIDSPEKHAGPVDEFDPAIFNRQMHPEKK